MNTTISMHSYSNKKFIRRFLVTIELRVSGICTNNTMEVMNVMKILIVQEVDNFAVSNRIFC